MVIQWLNWVFYHRVNLIPLPNSSLIGSVSLNKSSMKRINKCMVPMDSQTTHLKDNGTLNYHSGYP